MPDRTLVYTTAFLRSLAVSLTAVVLGVHLAAAGLPGEALGRVVGLGLLGGALAALLVTLAGDHLGRRTTLVALAVLSAAGAAAAAFATSTAALSLCAFAGMVNGMGRDRGAALILEQALLPSTVPGEERTRAFAIYNVLQDAGHALGALLAGLPLAAAAGPRGGSAPLILAALVLLACAPLHARLTARVEPVRRTRAAVSRESRGILTRISALFALDALGSGFLPAALLSYFFVERFSAGPQAIALLFFAARVANAASHLGAAWLARRIGLVNTMVFTHIPSSVLLATVAFAPSFEVAAALFVLREGLVEMDVPTRQSYVMAVVREEERTFASGVTNLVRLAAWAVAPPLAGILMSRLSLGAPLAIGAAIKIAYDLALYAAFRDLKPPEERRGP